MQVDDCIAKFLYMKSMTGKVRQLKEEGKPMPKDYQQLEREFGRCNFADQVACAFTWQHDTLGKGLFSGWLPTTSAHLTFHVMYVQVHGSLSELQLLRH